jgi:hypothetical protein
MSFNAEKLYNLLPEVYRVRDAGQGYALRQLVEIIASQAEVLEESLEQLYDNHFVETAAPWALPYIGDLLGIRGLSQSGALPLRAQIGNTMAYRKRKGTAAMIEMLAFDVTGWPARVVEFFDRLAVTQHYNHIRPNNQAFVDIRNANKMEFFNTPFETATRTVEVRRIEPGLGKWNIPNVGIFLWRLQAYSLTLSPMTQVIVNNSFSHFRFHPLGLDAPLFSLPKTEQEITHLAEPINVPMPISRRMLQGARAEGFEDMFHPCEEYFGPGGSIEIEGVAASGVLVCDLSDVRENPADPNSPVKTWAQENLAKTNATNGKTMVLIDPILGRSVFSKEQVTSPRATFHYGFSADIGGGEYGRISSFSIKAATVAEKTLKVKGSTGLETGLIAAAEACQDASLGSALVEIMDSGRYEIENTFNIGEGRLELRAADGYRPVVFVKQPAESESNDTVWQIKGAPTGTLILNGLLFSGAPLNIAGELGCLQVRHCSLQSHLRVNDRGLPAEELAKQACIEIRSTGTGAVFENSLLGPVKAGPGVRLRFKNCIIDARTAGKFALSDDSENSGPAYWSLENCTVIGRVTVGAIELASNTIFYGNEVKVQRRQEGCVRYCWLPADARVPRKFKCVSESDGLRPVFTTLEFNNPAYCQLGENCPVEISRGADDGAEMGAFHDLLQPQREASLRARLREYLRFGLDAGVFYVN